MKSAMAGELDGLIFYNGGGALDRLLDRAHCHVVWAGDGAGGGYCIKTFTPQVRHKFFARCDSKATATGSAGVVTLLGSTGPFTGIKGKGKFTVVGVTPVLNWDDIEWAWETRRPRDAPGGRCGTVEWSASIGAAASLVTRWPGSCSRGRTGRLGCSVVATNRGWRWSTKAPIGRARPRRRSWDERAVRCRRGRSRGRWQSAPRFEAPEVSRGQATRNATKRSASSTTK